MARTRDDYRKHDNADLKQRYLAALDRSTRASTTEAYLSDEFAMQEIWAVLEERGQPHPYVKAIRFEPFAA